MREEDLQHWHMYRADWLEKRAKELELAPLLYVIREVMLPDEYGPVLDDHEEE